MQPKRTSPPTPPSKSTFSSMSQKKLKAYIGDYTICYKHVKNEKKLSYLFKNDEDFRLAEAAWESFFHEGEDTQMSIPDCVYPRLNYLFRYVQLCTIFIVKPERASHTSHWYLPSCMVSVAWFKDATDIQQVMASCIVTIAMCFTIELHHRI